MSSGSSSSTSIGFAGVLAIVFIVLKLLDVITWSWWWVLSPIWISWGLALIFIGAIMAGGLISALMRRRR